MPAARKAALTPMLTAQDESDKDKRTSRPNFLDTEVRLLAAAARSIAAEAAENMIKPLTEKVFLVASMIFLQCGAAPAQEDAAARGAALAAGCTSCHGAEGRGGGAIPALAGRDAQDLAARMTELRAPIEGVTIMPRLMRAYDEAEIAALAAYFAGFVP